VYRWCDGSYLEDQDFWRLSGIQRTVFIHARPKIKIADYFAKAGLDENYEDGVLDLDLVITSTAENGKSGCTIEYKLLWDNDEIVTGEKDLNTEAQTESVSFSAVIDDVNKWTAETPNLYTLVLNLRDNRGEMLESISTGIGFRTVEIKDSKLYINGKYIYLKGVNLHEHHDVKGHVTDKETMLEDIMMMKSP